MNSDPHSDPESAPFTVPKTKGERRQQERGIIIDIDLEAADRPRLDGLGPLSEADQQIYKRQCAALAEHGRVRRGCDEDSYPFGESLRYARGTSLWGCVPNMGS